LQLQPDPALFPWLALLSEARRLMGGRAEVNVAQPSAATPRDKHPIPGLHQVGQDLIALGRADHRAWGDLEHQVLTAGAVLALPQAPSARSGLEVLLVGVGDEGVQLIVGFDVDRAAAPAVPAIGAAVRHVHLAPQVRGAIPSIAGLYINFYSVKHGCLPGRV